MKKPLALLIGILISIIILSIIFPADPQKPDLISLLKKSRDSQIKNPVNKETEKKYRIEGLTKIDDAGNALVWSPDEGYIYYSKKVKDQKEEGLDELWKSDLKGKKEKIESKIKLYNIKNGKWSLDGAFLAFISTLNDKNSLIIYDIKEGTVKDITSVKTSDIGVTSYDWDDDSLNIVMSLDIVNPRIQIYSLITQKSRKLDMKLKTCKDVAFYINGGIVFSDEDQDAKQNIYSCDKAGKNIEHIIEGQDFVISPDRCKLAILSNENSQEGLWIYNTRTKEKKSLTLYPVSCVYWLSNSLNLIYSMEEDTRNNYTYKGNIYYVEKNMNITSITGVIYTLFVPSKSGSDIVMTSQDSKIDKQDNKGVFFGELYK